MQTSRSTETLEDGNVTGFLSTVTAKSPVGVVSSLRAHIIFYSALNKISNWLPYIFTLVLKVRSDIIKCMIL